MKKDIVFPFSFIFLFLFVSIGVYSQSNLCFRTPYEFNFQGYPVLNSIDIAHGDMNNDGIQDLVTTHGMSSSYTNVFCVFLGNATSYFSSYTTNTLSGTASGSKLADFNNDGNLDVVVSYWSSDLLTFHFGNGSGGFSSSSTYTISPSVTVNSIGVGDLNNDGNKDVVALTNGGVFSIMGSGAGTFTAALPLGVVSYYNTIADFNNDGNLDIVAGDWTTTLFLKGNGTGNFISSTIGIPGSRVSSGDFNGDGKLDFISYASGDCLKICIGNGLGSFTAAATYSMNTTLVNIYATDLNNDSKSDIVAIAQTANKYFTFINQGGLNFDKKVHAGTNEPSAATFYDINGDSYNDIITSSTGSSPANNYVQINFSTATGDHQLPSHTGVYSNRASSVADIIITDIDNDSFDDLVQINTSWTAGVDSISIYKKIGNGMKLYKSFYLDNTGAAYTGIIADFNNDGNKDIAVTFAGPNKVVLLLGTGGGNFGPPSSFATASAPRELAAVDLNNNGILDLIVTNDLSDKISLYNGNGSGGFSLTTSFITGNLPRYLSTGDINKDGNADFVVGYLSATPCRAYFGNGVGGITATNYTFSAAYGKILLKDLNNDTNLDLIGGSTTYLGNGTTTFSFVNTYSGTGGYIATADFDMDGNLDVAYHSSLGLTIAKGTGTGALTSIINYTYTACSFRDIGVTDLNNDGVPDIIAQSNGCTGAAFILNSTAHLISSPTLTLCSGGSLLLTAGSGATGYTWTPGSSTTNTMIVTSPGTYYLTTSSSGCTSTSNTITVIPSATPAPTVNVISSATLLCSGNTATLSASGATTYSWSTGSGLSTATVSPVTTSSYVVTGTTGSCASTSIFTQSVSICTRINEYENDQALIYPNPFNDGFTIKVNSEYKMITIYNSFGQLIKNIEAQEEKTNIDLKNEASGIYFVIISNSNSRIIKKIVKE